MKLITLAFIYYESETNAESTSEKQITTYFCNVDKFDYDVCSLLRRGLTEDHTLHPLRQTIEERYGPLELGVVLQRPMHCIVFEVIKLKTKTEAADRWMLGCMMYVL